MLIGASAARSPRWPRWRRLSRSRSPTAATSSPTSSRELVDEAPGTVERVAFLRTRPGHFGPTDDDLAWAACLYAVARDAGLPCETVFLATDLVLVPMPMDAVGAAATA